MMKLVKNIWQGICESFDTDRPLLLKKRFVKKKKLKWKKQK